MHILTRAALVLVAFAVAFAMLVTAPRSSPVEAQAPMLAADSTTEAYTEVGQGPNDYDDSNDIAWFSTPGPVPEKRAGDSAYLRVVDTGPGSYGRSALFLFSVDTLSSAGASFRPGGQTLHCADYWGDCDLDPRSDVLTVRLDIANDAEDNTRVIVSLRNLSDHSETWFVIPVTAGPPVLPASFYGGGLDAGDVVTASIGGAACDEAEAGADGGWSILVEEGGCGGKAVDGAVVAFAINGVPAGQTATWRAGGLPDDREDGIPLTAAGMTIRLRLRGASAVYVRDVDGGFDIHVAGAPDFVNARFGQRWVAAATPFTLTLGMEGVRALYVQSTDRTFDSHIVGAPDFVNAAFARRWVVDAIE